MPRVDAVLGEDGRERLDVAERRSFAELDPHPGTELRERVLARGGLVARVDSGGDVGLEPVVADAGEAPVAGDGLAALERGRDLRVDALVSVDDAGHVHHLAEPGDPVPLERLADLVRPELCPRVLEPRQRRHAGRHRQEHLQRQLPPLLEHPAHSLEAEDVRHLVVVDERGGRPVRKHGLGEARDGDHHRLDVQVRVDQARDEVRAFRVDRLGLRADRVPDVAEHRHAAVGDRDVGAVEDLARVHVHEPAAADDEVGGPPAHADGGQLARELEKRTARHRRIVVTERSRATVEDVRLSRATAARTHRSSGVRTYAKAGAVLLLPLPAVRTGFLCIGNTGRTLSNGRRVI